MATPFRYSSPVPRNRMAIATICAVVFHFASFVTLSSFAEAPRYSRSPETNTSRNRITVAGRISHGFMPE
jgi:hypothetical protein